MAEVKYHSIFGRCVALLAENRNLFLPNMIMVIMSLVLVFLFLLSTGILSEVLSNPSLLADQDGLGQTIGSVKDAQPIFFWSLFGLYLLLIYMFDMFFITAKYGMIKDVLLDHKTSLRSGIVFAKGNYWKSFGMHILSYLLVISPIFFIAAAAVALGFVSGFYQKIGFVLIFLVFLLIVLVYWIEIFFRLLFLYPTMTFEGTTALESFSENFHYVKSHMGHTFISWIIFISIWAIYFLFRSPVSKATTSSTSIWGIVILTLVSILAEMVVSTFEHIFIFKSYLDGKGKVLKMATINNDWRELYE